MATKKEKSKNKRKRTPSQTEVVEEEKEEATEISPLRNSDDPIPKKSRWTNKQRVLIFAARGLSAHDRHLMNDLKSLMPHSKSEVKKNSKESISFISEMTEMRNCNKCLFFESKKRKDLYLWMSNVPKGPSAKFLVLNCHSMGQFKLSGNCLKASRPLLSFDETFEAPHWALLKELLTQIFSTPNHHPKSQPFFDHVFVFSVKDEKIWFRNFQIMEEDGQLAEIGPRFVLNPIKIFNGSFEGVTLWSNPKYVTPNESRRKKKFVDSTKYLENKSQKEKRQKKLSHMSFRGDPSAEVFETKPPEEAVGREKQLYIRKR